MAGASSLSGSIGVTKETTHGAYLAPATFIPHRNETLRPMDERIEQSSYFKGRRTPIRQTTGTKKVVGNIVTDLRLVTLAPLFRNAWGAPASSTESPPSSGVYNHTFTPGDISNESLSITLERPEVSGVQLNTVGNIVYGCSGMQTTGWSIEVQGGQSTYVTWTSNLYGGRWTDRGAPTSVTYGTDNPIVWNGGGGLTIDGDTLPYESLTISCNNNVEIDRFFVGGANPEHPYAVIDNGFRDYMVSISQRHYNNDDFARYISNSEATIVLTLENSAAERLEITMNGYIPEVTPPNLTGVERPTFGFEFKALHGTSDASAFTAVLRNNLTTI